MNARIAYAFAALTVICAAMAGVIGFTAYELATGDYLVFDRSVEFLTVLAGTMAAMSAFCAVSTVYHAKR
jgi:uncharacterized membrane protein YuzA (DUF378 family)